MSNLPFYILDVFAEEKYSGNQLAVVTNANQLSDEKMQRIANEMHFSETTFVKFKNAIDNIFDVRIFTPSMEVPFAGHPTLGTAYVINQYLAKKPNSKVILNLKIGKIEVTFENLQNGDQIEWMKQNPPTFEEILTQDFVKDLLNLQTIDFQAEFPIQIVSTGLPFVIVPLRSLAAVKKARINHALLSHLQAKRQAGVLVFCPQTYRKENDLNVRVFVDLFGIPEDPATGSGNGCLAAYLANYNYFSSPKINVKVEQGFEIGRPSILHLRSEKIGEKIEVQIGGKVFPIAKGKLLL